jgi:predicted RNA binding protein YcfA (HicA-like mRNA interferase family)
MSKKEKLILKLLAGVSDANFNIDDLVKLLEWLEFEERKTNGSHRIFSKKGIEGVINLQKTKDGKAKEYQVKQVRDFLVKNKLVPNE